MQRGRLLPISLREEIKARVMAGQCYRAIAAALAINKCTVQKYGRKFRTEILRTSEQGLG